MFKFCTLVTLLACSTALAATPYSATALPSQPTHAGPGKRFRVLTAEESGVSVPNVFNDPRMWGNRFRELTLGAVETGIAVADFFHDGRPAIFAISKNGPCALYRQTEPFKFSDQAKAAGVLCDEAGSSKTGATAVDINQDGWSDLYVCRYDAPNLLYVNNGDGTFTERAKEFGLDVKDASVHALFADYDRDGALDCYLVTNILDFSKAPQGRRDFLFRNDGKGHFTDVSKTAGIWGLTQGHTALWFDANADGWPDIYVANDFETPDRFYLNKGDGTFADVVDERLPHVTYFSMGADAADLNNDGRMDFFITDMRDRNHREFMTGMEEIGRGLWEMERVSELIPQYMWNAVYLNTGTDHYEEVAHLTGMEATGWTWCVRLGDLDNDGRVDAFFPCGMIRNFIDADLVDRQNVAPTLVARANVWKDAAPRAETALAFRNRGKLDFQDVSADWGLDHKGVSFGCALVDLDNDGNLDLVFANYDAPPTVVRNQGGAGHRAVVKLAGRAPNLEGIGAELRLETARGVQVRQLFTERGVVASEPALAHFGLGDEQQIQKLTIRWPRGQVQTLENLPVDQLLTITEPPLDETAKPAPAIFHTPPQKGALYTEAAATRGLKHVAAVRPFDEFSRQRLLPRRLNGMGPGLAVGDVNGDGRQDVFVSGAGAESGQLYLAQADGSFVAAAEQPWSAHGSADEVNAAFVDVNGDKHLDLVIVTGGVELPPGDAQLNDRVYLNDGHGRFTAGPADTIPANGQSKKAIASADFDGDGQSDLFVGGRVVAGRYPEAPQSFLYRNVSGKFVDVTDEWAPGLRQIGMVTSASFADIDRDGRPDLVATIEWGPVVYFRNTGHGFENATERAGLADVTGWWSGLAVADVNGDGRPDLVAGNVGLNTKYHASAAEPTVLFAGDLDGSGKQHLVEAQYEDGKLYPLRGRSKLGYVFPWLKKKFPTFKAYAAASVEEMFDPAKLAAARKLTANQLASGVFTQQADGRFAFQPLAREAQLGPINAVVVADLDGDGAQDLYCVGNNFGPEPNTGRFDGSLGILLKGDGGGGFAPCPACDSGLAVKGDVRAAVPLPAAAGQRPSILVARCDGPLLLFQPATL